MKKTDIFRAADHPLINSAIFFPRPDPGWPTPPGSEDHRIQVSPGVELAARLHPLGAETPMILHFHGNGEIVADYDAIAPAFLRAGASLFSVDYRGYGRSTGQPSSSTLVTDPHGVLDYVLEIRETRGLTGPLVVMGRSLGSIPAVELALARSRDLAGVVVESGFAQTLPFLSLLGIRAEDLGLDLTDCPDNEDKLAESPLPLLVLHAEGDDVLPPWHGKRNHERARARKKRLIMIPNADHGSIMLHGGELYWGGLENFLADLVRNTP